MTPDELRAVVALAQRRIALNPDVDIGDGQHGPSPGFIQARLYALEREERAVAALVETMRLERAQWELATLRTANALLPISRLPDEVLARVMEFSVASGGARLAETTVAQVCHRWRRVGLRHGPLWSNVTIKGDGDLERAEMYLQRSGMSSLRINIRDTNTFERNMIMDRIVRPHAGRCVEYCVSGDNRGIERSVWSPRVPMPMLQSVSLEYARPSPIFVPLFDDTQAAEIHLHHIRIASPASISRAFGNLDLSSLKRLTLTNGSDLSAIALINRSSALETLDWSSAVTYMGNMNTQITLPALKAARAIGGVPCVALMTTRAPVLECLDVVMHDPRSVIGQSIADPSTKSRHPCLRTICLRLTPNVVPIQLASLITSHRVLETLILVELTPNANGIDLLNSLEQSQRQSPSLRRLSVGFAPYMESTRVPTMWTPQPFERPTSSIFARFGQVFCHMLGASGRPPRSLLVRVEAVTIRSPDSTPADFGPALASLPGVDFVDNDHYLWRIEDEQCWPEGPV